MHLDNLSPHASNSRCIVGPSPPLESRSPMPSAPLVEALVDCPGTQAIYTYRIPDHLSIQPGDILAVPFGAQQLGAIALRLVSTPPEDLPWDQLKEVEDRVSSTLFPAGYWELLQRVSDYYHTPLIATIRVTLPPGLLRRSQRRVCLTLPEEFQNEWNELSAIAQRIITLLQKSSTEDYTWTYLQQKIPQAAKGLKELRQRDWIKTYLQPQPASKPKTQQMITLVADPMEAATERQQELLAVLKQQGGVQWVQDFLRTTKASPSTIKTLGEKGWISITAQERLRLEADPKGNEVHSVSADTHPRDLTRAQAQVLATINQSQGYQPLLLHGVTGSGKTEVYLQAIAPVLARGQSVLLLVPEIGLTPQISDRVRARFGDRVRVYHSALSDGERYDTWRQLLTADSMILVGTRSAIFAPVMNLGLIILDEEHDSGYKQDSPAPCYHARTVAHWRAEQVQCPLILGSATPSLETWVMAQAASPDSSHYLSLPDRVYQQPMPPIDLVDMREELQKGNRSMFSDRLHRALVNLQAEGQQGLLFINRRGHSTFVSCRSCGYVVNCPNCSVSLTYHQTENQTVPLLRCHYCNYTQRQPPQCPECHSPYFRYFGSGTQRVMAALREEFPELRVLRFDSDTTRRKGAHRQLLSEFAAGKVDLMVGTQMLTKGIDVPQVQFVGVLAADSLLNLSDFRASERTFQTLLQVAGRSGRGESPGRVVIQTYNPDHPVLMAVQRYGFEAFVESELAERQALAYPPYGQLISVRLSSPDPDLVERKAFELAKVLEQSLAIAPIPGIVMGPAPATILKVAKRYRWQMMLKFPEAQVGEPLAWELPLVELQRRCPKEIRLGIDVDPLHLL